MSDFATIPFKPITPVDQAVMANFETLEAYLQELNEQIAALKAQAAPPIPMTVGTFPVTLTGCTTVPTGTARYVRIGKKIIAFIPPLLQGTSNTTALQFRGWPASLIPSFNFTFPIPYLIDNSTAIFNCLGLWAGGFCSVLKGDGTNFTSAGTKGVGSFGFFIHYSLP